MARVLQQSVQKRHALFVARLINMEYITMGTLRKLRKFITRKNRPYQPRIYHDVGGTWGDHITWLSYPHKLYGHKSSTFGQPPVTLPEPGHYLKAPMQSGKVLICMIMKVRWANDPIDMFFLDVEPIEYEEG